MEPGGGTGLYRLRHGFKVLNRRNLASLPPILLLAWLILGVVGIRETPDPVLGPMQAFLLLIAAVWLESRIRGSTAFGNALSRLDEWLDASPRRGHKVLAVLGLGYMILLIWIVTAMYFRLSMTGINNLDLAIFTQSLWYTLNGEPFRNSLEGFMAGKQVVNHFAIHNQPLLALALPLYAILRTPLALPLFQILVLPFGGLFVFLLARRVSGSCAAGILLAVGYWFHPSVVHNTLDYHPVALVLLTIPAAFYFFETRRFVPGWIAVALTVLCKENLALVGIFFGVYLAIRHRRILQGAVVSLLCMGWFMLSVDVIMPWFRDGPYYFLGRYEHLGSNLYEVAWTVLSEPGRAASQVLSPAKLHFVVNQFQPFFLVPLFAPWLLLISVPEFAQNLLSSYELDLLPSGRTTVSIVCALTCALAVALARLGDGESRRRASRWLVGAFAVYSICVHGLPMFRAHIEAPYALPIEVVIEMPEVEALVGPEDSIAAHPTVTHWFAERSEIYAFPVRAEETDKVLIVKRLPHAFWPYPERQPAMEMWLRESPQHEILYESDTLVLFERTASTGG